VLQNLMSAYVEQSRALVEQLQRGAVFPGMPGFPPRK
jgi:hypothetical protein